MSSPRRSRFLIHVLVLVVGLLFGSSDVTSAQRGVRKPQIRASSHKSVPRKRPRPTPVPIPKVVPFTIRSKPAICNVTIPDQQPATTDETGKLIVELKPGKYRVQVSCKGYVAQDKDIEVLDIPESQEAYFYLEPALKKFTVKSEPASSEIYLNDSYKGITGAGNALLVLEGIDPTQTYVLRVRKVGYIEYSGPLPVDTDNLFIPLLKESAQLKVMTEPDAEVYLDDSYKGTSTATGVLLIEQVNPNQSHTVRVKKTGFRTQLETVSPNSKEVPVNLLPDPIVVMTRDLRQQISKGLLVEAVETLSRLWKADPENHELHRSWDGIIQSLQARSTESWKRVTHFGLTLPKQEVEEFDFLYLQSRKQGPVDESVANAALYWRVKSLFVTASTSSASERDALLKEAKGLMGEFGEFPLRNPYVLFDLGWLWMALGDEAKAEKNFSEAQKLKPDWSYPNFAQAVISLQAANAEVNKKTKTVKYQTAIDGLHKAIELKNDFPRAYALRCIIYSILKRHDEAIASGLQAVALDQKSAYTHFALGLAYFRKGKSSFRLARDEFNRSMAATASDVSQEERNSIKEFMIQINKAVK